MLWEGQRALLPSDHPWQQEEENRKKKKNCTPKEEPEIHPGPRLWKVSYSQGTAESPGRPHSPGTMPHANPRLRSRQSSVHLPPTCSDEDSKCQVTSHSVLLLGETSSLRGRCKGNPEAGGGQILRKPPGNNSNALHLIKQTSTLYNGLPRWH